MHTNMHTHIQVSEANEKGRAAVQDLTVILDYFDEQDREVKVCVCVSGRVCVCVRVCECVCMI